MSNDTPHPSCFWCSHCIIRCMYGKFSFQCELTEEYHKGRYECERWKQIKLS